MSSCDYKIINDNGMVDLISCANRTEAIETYSLIYGYTKEYVKEHCIVKPIFTRSEKAKGE